MARLPKTKEDLKRRLPILDETLEVRGLNGGIQILRDGYGIPQAKAEDTHGAFFGQAFATAQPRRRWLLKTRVRAKWIGYAV